MIDKKKSEHKFILDETDYNNALLDSDAIVMEQLYRFEITLKPNWAEINKDRKFTPYVATSFINYIKNIQDYHEFIIKLIAKELGEIGPIRGVSYIKRLSTSNLAVNTKIPQACIRSALQEYPFNGAVIKYAVEHNVLDHELLSLCNDIPDTFFDDVVDDSVAFLSEIYNNGKQFNKPLMNDQNSFYLERMHSAFAETQMPGTDVSVWQAIISTVYSDRLQPIVKKINDVLQCQTANGAYNVAQRNEPIEITNIDKTDFLTFVIDLEEKECCACYKGLSLQEETYNRQLSEAITIAQNNYTTQRAIIEKEREDATLSLNINNITFDIKENRKYFWLCFICFIEFMGMVIYKIAQDRLGGVIFWTPLALFCFIGVIIFSKAINQNKKQLKKLKQSLNSTNQSKKSER